MLNEKFSSKKKTVSSTPQGPRQKREDGGWTCEDFRKLWKGSESRPEVLCR